MTVTRQIHFAVKGNRKRAIAGPAPEKTAPQSRIPRISKLMALAIRFDQLLKDGVVANQSELARLAHVTQPRMTQIMNLRNLAPDIQEKILFLPIVERGRDPIHERMMRNLTHAMMWREQRRRWGAIRDR